MECACCHKIRHEKQGRKAHQVFVCAECIIILMEKWVGGKGCGCNCSALVTLGERHENTCDFLQPAQYELGRFGEITEL